MNKPFSGILVAKEHKTYEDHECKNRALYVVQAGFAVCVDVTQCEHPCHYGEEEFGIVGEVIPSPKFFLENETRFIRNITGYRFRQQCETAILLYTIKNQSEAISNIIGEAAKDLTNV